jgi:HEPN superfamily AbiV-like protein
MDALSLEQIEEFSVAAVENGSDLLDDADVLLAAERYSSAYFLARIALEEAVKPIDGGGYRARARCERGLEEARSGAFAAPAEDEAVSLQRRGSRGPVWSAFRYSKGLPERGCSPRTMSTSQWACRATSCPTLPANRRSKKPGS